MTRYPIQDFDSWNELKKKIEFSGDIKKFPKEKEVWMCYLGVNIGYEQGGKGSNFFRPVLIIKKFNNNIFWVVPLSTKQKHFDFYLNFTDPHDRKVSAILVQMKLTSIKRLERFLYSIQDEIFYQIKEKLKSLI